MNKLWLLLVVGLLACSRSEVNAGESPVEEGGRLVVYTDNYPLAFFTEWIGGEAVRVEFPAPADVDPAFWTPDPETIAAYRKADVVFLNGAGYTRWSEDGDLPASLTVNTSATLKKRVIDLPEHPDGALGMEGPGTSISATWLDPTFAVEQARTIAFVLSGARPAFEEDFQRGFAALEAELLELDERWRAIVASAPDQPLLGSRPVYPYLEQRLDLNLVSLAWEPDVALETENWEAFETTLRSHPARWMLWADEPRPEVVERLESLGVESLVFDPCGNVPASADDFLDVMQANTETLERVFTPSRPTDR